MRVFGDRDLPGGTAFERGEVVPEVEHGPHAERQDGERGAQAIADEAGVGGDFGFVAVGCGAHDGGSLTTVWGRNGIL